MAKIRVIKLANKSKIGYYLAFRKEILSGPWPDIKKAIAAKQEWIIV